MLPVGNRRANYRPGSGHANGRLVHQLVAGGRGAAGPEGACSLPLRPPFCCYRLAALVKGFRIAANEIGSATASRQQPRPRPDARAAIKYGSGIMGTIDDGTFRGAFRPVWVGPRTATVRQRHCSSCSRLLAYLVSADRHALQSGQSLGRSIAVEGCSAINISRTSKLELLVPRLFWPLHGLRKAKLKVH